MLTEYLQDLYIDEISCALSHLDQENNAFDLLNEAIKYIRKATNEDVDLSETLIIAARLFIEPNNPAHRITCKLLIDIAETISNFGKPSKTNHEEESEYDGWDDWEFIEKIEDLEMDLIKSKIEVRRLKDLLTKAGLSHE